MYVLARMYNACRVKWGMAVAQREAGCCASVVHHEGHGWAFGHLLRSAVS